ncbi:hypothetical protein CSA56_00330 [candidate division KSB3 bacterium]|uniref:Tetratricopeptide repeat protein n=1 Tax=candidate division KSB3 bacterium TaxID=2044937 RepID=A0A2G6KLD1_9BACT|nr:MAG: hypothetical protein CSA56_00330 [candidate division KSB3 bacterium]
MAKKSSFFDVVKGITQKKGGKDKEVEKYEKILEEQPDDRNALNALGDLYAKRGNPDKACEYYLQVGSLYAKDGFTLKAIAVYKKAQRAKPEQTGTYLELADLYVQKGLIGEAKSNYLQAAEMQAAAGEKHESLDTYRKIADLDPNNIKIRTKLAAMYESEDFMEDAAGIYVDIGDVIIQEDLQEGQAYYHRAIELQPENEEILSRIGYSYADMNIQDQAANIFQQLYTMFPDNIDYKEQVEMKTDSAPADLQSQPTLSTSIEFSEEELTSLNFGEDEPIQEHTLDFQVEPLDNELTDLSQSDDSSDEHTLDFQIEEQGTIAWDNDSTSTAPSLPPSPPDTDGFFDLASKLDSSVQFDRGSIPQEQNFSSLAPNLKIEAPEKLATSEIGDIVREFKQGVLEEVGAEDYETHYELGISYKEMSLLDDAIEELQLASLEPAKFVECQSVIALCYVEKGDYDRATQSLLEARARVEQKRERYQDLTYQIASYYEQGGRQGEAVHMFQELFQINPGYRDIKARLNRLLA